MDSLSRGMKQRLCLARSLIHDPKLLILDEPASGLDPRARVEMKEILKQLQSMGKTVVISSHTARIGGDVYRSGHHQSGETGGTRDCAGNHAAADPETHYLCASFGRAI